jgi:hypothetical protein
MMELLVFAGTLAGFYFLLRAIWKYELKLAKNPKNF